MMKMEKLNPSVKMFTVLIAVLLLSFQHSTLLNLLVFFLSLFLLLVFSDMNYQRLLRLLLPAGITAFGLFMMGLYYGRAGSGILQNMTELTLASDRMLVVMEANLSTALQLSSRLLAYAGMGILFALTTEGEYFVRSLMHQCRLSPKFAYGILAAFYLMPIMSREFKKVQLAFRVRNVRAGSLSPKVLFAMMVNSIRWSECLAMAMESKGFDGEAARTYREIPVVCWYDVAFAVSVIGGIVLGSRIV